MKEETVAAWLVVRWAFSRAGSLVGLMAAWMVDLKVDEMALRKVGERVAR